MNARTDRDRKDSAQRLAALGLLTLLALLGATSLATRVEAQEPFDHFSTGFVLDGAHANVSCESCHTYGVDAVCVDSPGIVHSLAEFFASRKINIEELNTNRYAAPHTGTPMFSVHMAIAVPANQHLNTLREEFFSFCDEINLDAVLEPVKH